VLVSPDGSNHKLFPSPERIWVFENFVFWSNDGATLYFATSLNGGARLWALEIASGRWRKIADWGESLRFGPRLSNTCSGTISPDGKSVMTTALVLSADLWILEGFQLPDAAGHSWLNRLGRLLRGSGK